jgi:hypothetical protein
MLDVAGHNKMFTNSIKVMSNAVPVNRDSSGGKPLIVLVCSRYRFIARMQPVRFRSTSAPYHDPSLYHHRTYHSGQNLCLGAAGILGEVYRLSS